MIKLDKSGSASAWAGLACLTPLFIVADDAVGGIVLGMALLAIHSAASAAALLLPARLGEVRIFWLSSLVAAATASLAASTLRLIDPFLFESYAPGVFLAVYTLPVLSVCVPPEGIAERERTLEHMLRGLGYAVAIAGFGMLREFVSTGALGFGDRAGTGAFLPFAGQAAGAFILLGLLAAGAKAVLGAAKRSVS